MSLEAMSAKDGQKLAHARERHARGDLEGVRPVYRRLLRKYPRNGDVQALLAALHLDSEEPHEALQLLRRLEQSRRDDPDVHYNLGLAYRVTGDNEQAAAAYRRALALHPEHPLAHYNLALALDSCGERNAAIDHARKDYALQPRIDSARLLAKWLVAKPHEAFPYAQAVVEMEGATPADLDHLVAILYDVVASSALVADDQLSVLQAYAGHAIELTPNSVASLVNAARVLTQTGRFEESLPLLEKATLLKPEDQSIRSIYGVALATHGEIREGWRQRTLLTRSGPGNGTWRGELTSPCALEINAEEGVGDQLLGLVLVRQLSMHDFSVAYRCDERLHALVELLLPDVSLDAIEGAERISLGDLHRLRHRTRADIDFAMQPIGCIEGRDIRQRYEAMAPGHRLVGLSWLSHSAHNGASKSVSLEALLPVLKLPQTTFVSTQYGDGNAELAEFAQAHDVPVIIDDAIDPQRDFVAAAQQLAALDSHVSVSNASVHLAGLVGTPTHVLVGMRPVWHWFDEGDTTPWYPSVRLHRQDTLAGWDNAIASVCRAVSI